MSNPLSPFYRALTETLADICVSEDTIARRVLHDYGAIYVGSKDILPPPLCVFTSEGAVASFQKLAGWATAKIGEDEVELQPPAMKALLSARKVAVAEGFNITPRDGAEAARRGYGDTVRLWNSRFLPALDYWEQLGRLTPEQTKRLRSLPIPEQVAEVLELEKQGMFFSKDFSKSVLYSIAAPGTSQHIAMLAFDVNEFAEARVREILAENGWFQTVLSDLPHFTYLGVSEAHLKNLGLTKRTTDGRTFWVPDI